MVVKNQKLHEQFNAEASTSSHGGSVFGKPIFLGVSIFVDGFTVPSSQELRGYMVKHGGHFENYFSRHRVTHIICSNLPDSKIKNLRSFSGGLPVVKPTWVLDSVAANKLLSWHTYQLDQLASETQNQPKLSAFFSLKRSTFSSKADTYVTSQLISESEDPAQKVNTAVNEISFGEGESTEHLKQCSEESDNPVLENFTGEKLEETSFSDINQWAASTSEPDDAVKTDSDFVGIQPEYSSPSRPSTSVSSYCLDNQNSKESQISRIVVASNQRHSTLVDPNFVENYFKNSRLHFIGTWRNRYHKRFPKFSNEFECTKSSVIASATHEKTAIVHVDLDCFFVSVVIRNHPELQDKPVAVCHSDNPRGTAEISSANYPARNYGVRAGIFVRDAKALCPHLAIFPYNFEAYEEVADKFYDILHKHCNKVQAVSCDEAFLDVTDSEVEDHQLLASIIRKEIFDSTGCTASAGIARNMLMARLATRTAKPDGQCYIPADKVEEYLHELPIKALPGIGHVLEEKLKRRQVKTCGQLRMISKESLRKDFGLKTGDMLWNHSRGIDNRLVGVIQESKSIGADVNWGVRFNDLKDTQHFLANLCKEVSLRLQGCGVQGRTFTLKVKKRRNDAKEPVKYMGCGDCENLSHSITVPMATDDADVLQRITGKLFGSFHIDVKEIRGMGLQVSKLENADSGKQGNERNSIRSWLISASTSKRDQCEIGGLAKANANGDLEKQNDDGNLGQSCTNLTVSRKSNGEGHINHDSTLPPLCDLDMGVIESLPRDLLSEINDLYGGMLISLMSKHKGKSANIGSLWPTSSGSGGGVTYEEKATLLTSLAPSRQCTVDNRVEETSNRDFNAENSLLKSSVHEKKNQSTVERVQSASVSGAGTLTMTSSFPEDNNVMPFSLSQVDLSVLQQLPEEMKVDILELLPPHRRQECTSDLGPHKSYPRDSFHVECIGNHRGSRDSVSDNELLIGNPPRWVDNFKLRNCVISNIFADMYYKSGSTGQLSSILQRTMSDFRFPLGSNTDGLDDAIRCLSELLKQYIKLKIETDIEEIYLCFCLLRRLSTKSTSFLEVYKVILPDIQATVGEHYGGNFRT